MTPVSVATSPRSRPITPEEEDAPGVGRLLRGWRERRRLSQLELSLQAEVSTRHLSFIETGRSKPTSEMIMRLTEHLDVRCGSATRCCSPAGTPPRTRSMT